MNARPSARGLVVVVALVVVGALTFATMTSADPKQPPAAPSRYQIVDTAGSAFLLDTENGQVWRLGFTEVKGDRFWFGTYVPMQPPTPFEEFQESLRKRLGAAK
jgi:hypothetical protein